MATRFTEVPSGIHCTLTVSPSPSEISVEMVSPFCQLNSVLEPEGLALGTQSPSSAGASNRRSPLASAASMQCEKPGHATRLLFADVPAHAFAGVTPSCFVVGWIVQLMLLVFRFVRM